MRFNRFSKTPFVLGMGLLILSFGCQSAPEPMPKPKALWAMSYPEPVPVVHQTQWFSMSYNQAALLTPLSNGRFVWHYPELKADVWVTYTPLDLHDPEAWNQAVLDVEDKVALHQDHASGILVQPYENPQTSVYGAIYEIQGNAASQAHFYLTDKRKHLLHGALYFRAKPQYDSLMPAAQYVLRDLRDLTESLTWK